MNSDIEDLRNLDDHIEEDLNDEDRKELEQMDFAGDDNLLNKELNECESDY